MTRDEIFAQVKSILVDTLSVDEDKVTMEARFQEDLETDSLDLVELVMTMEETVPHQDQRRRGGRDQDRRRRRRVRRDEDRLALGGAVGRARQGAAPAGGRRPLSS